MTHTQTKRLVAVIAKILHGENADTQGSALADLVAIWFAGHHPEIRGEVREVWLKLVDELVPIAEEIALRAAGVTRWDDLPDDADDESDERSTEH